MCYLSILAATEKTTGELNVKIPHETSIILIKKFFNFKIFFLESTKKETGKNRKF